MTLPPLLALAKGIRARPRKAKAPRDRNAEARIQAAIVEWIRTVAPDLICFHPANGGYRTKAEAARLKWVGVLAGIPDIVILGPGGRAWLVEVKAQHGTMSTDQRAIRNRCLALRIPFATARSIDEVRWAFDAWNIHTREVRTLPRELPSDLVAFGERAEAET